MKVVLFCGGLGLRLRDHPDGLPKPMVTIGHRPILWHIMRYYAHFGHRDFVLCLGYGAHDIKDYFLNYSEAMSNDFVLSNGGQDIELLSSDIDDWHITFVDTGRHASVGERLMTVKGCVACHTTDGTAMVGPSYKGLYGSQRTVVTEGETRETVADDDYVRRSILEPAVMRPCASVSYSMTSNVMPLSFPFSTTNRFGA